MMTFRKTGSDMDGIDDFLCIENARLIKREGNGFLEYRVDGKVVEDFQDALSKPVETSPAELSMLKKLTDEPVAALRMYPREVVASLFHKGLLKIDGQLAWITEAGKAHRGEK